MKYKYFISLFWLCLVVVSCPVSAYLIDRNTYSSEQTEPRQIVIKLKSGFHSKFITDKGGGILVDDADFISACGRYGVETVSLLNPPNKALYYPEVLTGILLVKLPEEADIREAAMSFADLDIAEYAHPDWNLELYELPDESLYSHQWALNNTGQGYYHVLRREGTNNDTLILEYGVADADIDAREVFTNPPDKTVTTVVAIIDTGVDLDHPDLGANIWTNSGEIAANGIDDDHNGYVDDIYGWDFSGDPDTLSFLPEGDDDPTDYYGHGTHCAGIVAAVPGNGTGIAGIANDFKIMALKIYPIMQASVAARAIVYAAENGADVISMSWGAPWPLPVVEEALTYARSHGVVLCAASGNNGTEMYNYPASYPGVITVGATTSDDEVAYFSTYGNYLDLVAPGQSILSLRADTSDIYASGNEPLVHIIDSLYYLASGTSMACPHVTGAAAYLRAVSPGLYPLRIEEILEQTADDIVDPFGIGESHIGWDIYSGAGRVNLDRALDEAPDIRARILYPHPNQPLSGMVDIIGIADGTEFNDYILEYGQGYQPDEWSEIISSFSPVTEDILAQWDTDALNGRYILRLRVGEHNESMVSLSLTNSIIADLFTPSINDTLIAWTEITGSASCPNFKSYKLEYGLGISPDEWSLIAESGVPMVNGCLADWNLGTVNDGWYTVRLSVFSEAGLEADESIPVYLRSFFSGEDGWKVSLNTTDPAIVANYGDFNADGINEIVVGTSEGIKFFNLDGSPRLSDIPEIDDSHRFQIPVAVGDLDGDGLDDLVAVDNEGIILGFPSRERNFKTATGLLPDINEISYGDEFHIPLVFLRDIDGDNRDEIHYYPGGDRSDYYIYNGDGTLRMKAPVILPYSGGYFYDYLPADLDDDGIDELYMANSRVFRADFTGEIIDTFDLRMDSGRQFRALSMSTSDIDGDEKNELIVLGNFADLDKEYFIFAFDENLALKDGWPHETGIGAFLIPSEPVFGDIDGDDIPEYYLTLYDLEYGYVYAWHIDGHAYGLDTTSAIFAVSPNPAILKTPVLADIDGDTETEFITCASSDAFFSYLQERLLAWGPDGKLESGWPIVVETDLEIMGHAWRNAVSVGDIDTDGKTDLLMTTTENSLVFVEFPESNYSRENVEVPFWRYNRRLNNNAESDNVFRIVGVTPTRWESMVRPDADITVLFSDEVDIGTLDESDITVTASHTGVHQGTLSYNNALKMAVFASNEDFLSGEEVTVSVSSDIRSFEGKILKRSFSWIFPVLGQVPDVISAAPSNGSTEIPSNTLISATFNTDIDPSTLLSITMSACGSINGKYPGSIVYDSASRTVTYYPFRNFEAGEYITVSIADSIRSIRGFRPDEEYKWTFRVYLKYIEPLLISPAPNSSNIPFDAAIQIKMNTIPVTDSISENNFVVSSSSGTRYRGRLDYNAFDSSITFDSDKDFIPGDRIIVALTERILPQDTSFRSKNWIWSFTTGVNNAKAEFSAATVYQSDSMPIWVCPADIDGDGDLDLAAANWDTDNISIFINSGNGGLDYETSYPVGKAPRGIRAGDLNGDDYIDLVSVNYSTYDADISILFNDGYGRFISRHDIHLSGRVRSVYSADFDGDGDIDLAAVNSTTSGISILKNNGFGDFSQSVVFPEDISTAPQAPDFITGGDFDGDFDIDLVTVSRSHDEAAVLLNDSSGAFTLDSIYSIGSSPYGIASADLDNDGDIDLATANYYSSDVSILINDGSGAFVRINELDVDDYPVSVVLSDFDGDGDPDLVTSTGMTICMIENNGDRTFQPYRSFPSGADAFSLAASDLDGDHAIDLVTANRYDNSISVLFNMRELNPTDDWLVVHCQQPRYDFETMSPGGLLAAYDPEGALCGSAEIEADGSLGIMHIYGDWRGTADIDEGAEPGDTISFRIDGTWVRSDPVVVWSQTIHEYELCRFYSYRNFIVPLESGWNLVSWNIDNVVEDIDSVLAPIAGCVEKVYGYENGGLTYCGDYPYQSTLTSVDHHHGYWIKIRPECDSLLLKVSGILPVPEEPIDLESGWNLVSYLPAESDTITDALCPRDNDNIIIVLGYDGHPQTYAPGLEGVDWTLTEMSPGRGYWLKVKNRDYLKFGDCSWNKNLFQPHKDSISIMGINPTNKWIDLYSNQVTINGITVAEGVLIRAISDENLTVGAGVVGEDGIFGFMPVYGNDPFTDEIDGLKKGDNFSLIVGGVMVREKFTWTISGDIIEIGELTTIDRPADVPYVFALKQNYPNPFNPATDIAFSLPDEAHTIVQVYNILGQKVITLLDKHLLAGEYTVSWDGRDRHGHEAATGVYLYRLDSGDFTASRKMLLLK